MKITNKSKSKNTLIAGGLILALICGILTAVLVLAKNNDITSIQDVGEIITGKSTGDESSNPAAKNEPKDSEKITPPNSDRAEALPTNEATGKLSIPVVASSVVDGSIVYIRGGLNVMRSTGTCVAQLKGPDSEIIRKDTTLLPNASTTDCRTISIPVSELSSGRWTFTLNYSDVDAEGESSVVSFDI